MTRRKCERCLDVLPVTTPANYRKCRQCFINDKKREERELHIRAEDAEAKCAQLACELMYAQRELAQAQSRQPDPVKALREFGFDRQTITRLIALCHPDRHDGSTAANELTAMLLSVRQKMV